MELLQRYSKALAAESAFAPIPLLPSLGSATVDALRRGYSGGSLTPMSRTELRWYPADVESALHYADSGTMSEAARLWRACQHDGVVRGVMSTRTDGLVRLPKQFHGNAEASAMLRQGEDTVRSLFDAMFPPAELAALTRDGIGLGVGIAELTPVEGREFPVLTRLEPEFLRYVQNESRWYYSSNQGDLPIIPGDGHWVLHMPGGRVNPWQAGLWAAVGEAWIHKTHARAYSSNWQAKLANPARVAVSPSGGTDEHSQSWFENVMAWGVDTTFAAPPGYDVKILESNGRGADSFETAQDRADREIIIAISGQEVTVDGGSGFQNNEIFSAIRADLIQATADSLAYTINTQGLPQWLVQEFGEAGLTDPAVVQWDITPPQDRKAYAEANKSTAESIDALTGALAPYGLRPSVAQILERAGVVYEVSPVVEGMSHDAVPA